MKNRIRRKRTRSRRKGSEERAAESPDRKMQEAVKPEENQPCASQLRNPNHRLLDQHSTKSEQLVSIFIGPSAR